MTDLVLFSIMAAVFAFASLLRAARRRSYCPPSDHWLTVVRARRVRDGLIQRYWIRCRVCDLDHGPYDNWQAAWQDAVQAQIATRAR
jgi:hypothetical protein